MCNKELTVNTNVWPENEYSKGSDEALKIHTTYENAKDENKICSVQIKSNTTVTYPSGKLLHPKEYCLKYHIYEKVQSLSVDANDANKVLLASYGEAQEPDKKYDLENKLFYNIGTGAFSSIFKKFPKQVAFKKTNYNPDDEESSYRYLYKYEVVKKLPNGILNKLCVDNIIAKWQDVPIGPKQGKDDKPDRYYAALRSASVRVANDASDEPGKNEVMLCGLERCDETAFGIKITLTVPESNKTTHPVSVMKHLLDGVICAFHGEKGETEQMLKEKFKDEELKCQADWPILGNQDYLRKYGNGFKWYPADEANRLKFGWIIVKCDGKEYKMSGEIYKWE